MLYSTLAEPHFSKQVLGFKAYPEPEDKQTWLRSNIAEIANYLHIPDSPIFQHDHELFQHIHYKAGQTIFSTGERFNAIYLVNSGFTKSVIMDEFGNEQIVNFQMKGDVLGVDGIHAGFHHSGAIALSECDMILLPLKKLTLISKTYSQFEKAVLNLISMEMIFQQNRLCILAAKNAEVRVAAFLLNLSNRFFRLGYSRSIFNLRMTRNDLGSYLGLTLETVSRSLSMLDDSGLIQVNHRGIVIRDESGLLNLTSIKKGSLK
jgi:CRP/FNR family transcriptional regulator